jgi:hypothetical protein
LRQPLFPLPPAKSMLPAVLLQYRLVSFLALMDVAYETEVYLYLCSLTTFSGVLINNRL